jgi:hypothetical protein
MNKKAIELMQLESMGFTSDSFFEGMKRGTSDPQMLKNIDEKMLEMFKSELTDLPFDSILDEK